MQNHTTIARHIFNANFKKILILHTNADLKSMVWVAESRLTIYLLGYWSPSQDFQSQEFLNPFKSEFAKHVPQFTAFVGQGCASLESIVIRLVANMLTGLKFCERLESLVHFMEDTKSGREERKKK
jgi:hypothetical protein